MRLLRFRDLHDYASAQRALADLPGLTDLPGGVLGVPDDAYDAAAELMTAAQIDWRWEPVGGFLGGRVGDEEGPEATRSDEW